MSGEDPPESTADSSAVDGETKDVPVPSKEKKADGKKSKKSKSGEKSIDEMFSNFGSAAVEWGSDGDAMGMNGGENWATEVVAAAADNESPSMWDPKEFDEQTSNLDPWKESTEVTRLIDLPSPSLAEVSPDQRRAGDEEDEWPFKSPCSFQEKKRRKSRAYNFAHTVSPDSVGSKSKGKKNKKDDAPPMVQRSVSSEGELDGDDDINEDDNDSKEALKMRDTWKGSGSKEDAPATGSRRGRKKDSEPAMPRRSRGSRPDADEDADQPPAQPNKNQSDDEGVDCGDDGNKMKRGSSRSESEESTDAADGGDELGGNSFHQLAKDFDKPTKPTRSTSRGRKSKAPGSGSGRRRRLKDRALDNSSHNDDSHSEVYEEFGEDEHEIRLKDGDSSDPGSGGSKNRMSWRDRRARKLGEEPNGEAPSQPLTAPGSGGRRPPRRGVGRASSERWKRAVEGDDNSGEDVQGRARAALRDANAELSRSAHSIRRHHSGGAYAMPGSLDARSYHGTTNESRRPPMRTPRKQIRKDPGNVDSGGSFGDDYDDYELNLSGRSARTLDSIEDLEDFEHMDFQTPGMVDYDEEILELMQKANPEHTAQLNRRVHRKRDAVNYDQNMPMMTRQALLTRQASAQVQRGRVDGNSIDRQRLLLRSDSMSSQDANDLSMSQHRSGRPAPGGRRAPPRTKSSGMAAMARNDGVPGFMQQQPAARADPENRRGVFRTRSNTASFTQYRNKPNRVSSISRRAPGSGDQIDPHSMRGAPSSNSALSSKEPNRGNLQRAKSTTALRPARRLDPRAVPTEPNKEGVPELKKESALKKSKQEATTKDDDSDVSEDSDVESMEGDSVSPKKASPKKPEPKKLSKPRQKSRSVPTASSVKSPIPVKAKKSTDKRDMLNKRNRSKLHAMMYEVKMGVDMKDLFVEVQKGEIPKSPIKSLMMPSP